jgi:sporulation protein YlmC with PRC-barrel domain
MLLSEMLNRPVRSPRGEEIGRVVDVRFRRAARSGRYEGNLELIALIVSPRSRLSLLGYERGSVKGPAVIAAFVRWLHRDSFIVPWECVARLDDRGVTLGVSPPRIPLDPTRDIEDP